MSIPQKIIYKLNILLTTCLIKLSVILNSPKLTAIFFYRAIKKVDTHLAHAKYKVLCLRRNIFMEDVKALATFGKQTHYYIIGRRHFQIIFNHFVSQADRHKLEEANYHTQPIGESGKKKYNLYLQAMLPQLRKLAKFDALLTCNTGYIEQQELFKVAVQQKIPFIVLHKEGLGAYGDFSSDIVPHKAFQFLGNKILFYNQRIKAAFLKLTKTNFTPDKMEVVGIPRFDFYLNRKGQSIKDKQVIFFSFFPADNFIDLIKDPQELASAKAKYDFYHKAIMDFAVKHPDFQVILKTKGAPQFLAYAQNIFDQNFKQPVPNLIITNAGKSSELIQESAVVIGFNSTTLLEAVAASKTVISPYFRDFAKDKVWDLFEGYGQLVNYAHNEQDFAKYILNYKDCANNIPELRDKYLEQFMFTPDGHASLRTENAIIKVIQNIN